MAYPSTVQFRPTVATIGCQPINESSAEKTTALGNIIRAFDLALGEAEFIYLKGAALTEKGDLCCYDLSAGTTVRAVNGGAGVVGPCAIAMSDSTTDRYGWYQISGAGPVKAATVLANKPAFLTSTAGQVDDATLSGGAVDGMTFKTTDSGGFATVQLSRPSINLQSGNSSTIVTTEQVGIGTSTPGEKLDVKDGNIRIDADSEKGLIVRYRGTLGSYTNPYIQFARLYVAGIGEPAWAVFFGADNVSEQRIVSGEATGTLAAIQRTRRSLFEGFWEGFVNPLFRLSTYTKMILELGGSGGVAPVGQMSRSSNVVTVNTKDKDGSAINHNLSVGQTVNVSPGEANFASGDKTVSAVTDSDTFQYAESGSDATNTVEQNLSTDTSVGMEQTAWKALGFVIKSSGTWYRKMTVYEDAIVVEGGVGLALPYSDQRSVNGGAGGNCTINAVSGRARIPAGSTEITVTCDQCRSDSRIHPVVETAPDATLTNVRPTSLASGSFKLTGNAAATSAVDVAFTLFRT